MTKNEISFSNQVKIKLSSIFPVEDHCATCELAGMTLYSSGFNKNKIEIISDLPDVVEKYIGLLIKCTNFNVLPNEKVNIQNSKYYLSLTSSQSEYLYETLSNNGSIDYSLFKCSKCKDSFLRGAFLVSGYVNPPNKSYDLEFKTEDVNLSCDLDVLLSKVIPEPKMSYRNGNQIVYTKKGDNVYALLNLMGATNFSFDIINSQLMKSIKNEQNRQVNFIVANLKKQSAASRIQIEAIKYLKKTKKIKQLSPVLIKTADLRYKYQDLSIEQLASLENPKVSKSQESKRLSTIVKIYQEEINKKG